MGTMFHKVYLQRNMNIHTLLDLQEILFSRINVFFFIFSGILNRVLNVLAYFSEVQLFG